MATKIYIATHPQNGNKTHASPTNKIKFFKTRIKAIKSGK
jgi:hypothetical protein